MTVTYTLEWLKLKRWTIPSAGEDVEQPELSKTASGKGKMFQPLRKTV